ncbi:hypothetical protein [Streptosporangium carneum]|uniref:Uncharacterized protein n=1 Tax=Streptosporangium carneum TaxID=47481 RepID=A0A9W6HXL4_9ACTN|nr:hypothetical protein [Streptosporangium carneum]GLK07264.1 hypothetical protein GCM10017600_06690 [Streptosporangium carneum]
MGRHRQEPYEEWAATWNEQNPDVWLAPLTGSRTERQVRPTLTERGLRLARRVGLRAQRLRQALAKGGPR